MMMRLSEAATAIGAELAGDDRGFAAVGTDTRALVADALFVALRGERFDGHRFVSAARVAGAGAALIERAALAGCRTDEPGLSYLVVDDTRAALGRLAAYWRGKFAPALVALTGSSGKTTVKEMLAGVLREACVAARLPAPDAAVLATQGNLNNDIGVPLTLFRLTDTHRYAVIEMGMNHAGEIGYLTRLARPDVAMVINAGHAHLGEVGSLEGIANAKGEIFEGLGTSGVAVINADDRNASLWLRMNRGRRVIDFGLEHAAAVTGRYELSGVSSEIELKTPTGEARASINVPGLHNVRNALAAAAAAHAVGVRADVIARGLGRFGGVAGRLQRKRALGGATLIDDTYNANPDSVRAAIAVLAAAGGERVLVLGDMGELGDAGPALHRDAGACARAAGIPRLLALGDLSEHAVVAFGPGGRHFPKIEELLAELEAMLAPGVTVLVKGSRFMNMERIVQAFEEAGAACC